MANVKLVAAAIGVSASGLALAQETQPFYFRLGAQYPVSANTRRAVDDFGFTVGVGYLLPTQPLLVQRNSIPSVEAMFARFGGGGNRINTFTLHYQERVFIGERAEEQMGWYAGGGFGLQWADIDVTTGSEDVGSGGDSMLEEITRVNVRRMTPSAELMLGYRFNEKSTIEAGLRGTPNVRGVNTSAWTLTATIRF